MIVLEKSTVRESQRNEPDWMRRSGYKLKQSITLCCLNSGPSSFNGSVNAWYDSGKLIGAP